ncbi:hypothetical protein FALBO_7712 [Fusarium albosuccineum]|uniref:Uncharacterized protein n=1 Tax=Fusarium albosuccineum TaxID=1237068 RepID=A0A8H4LCB7_9HYPO|nr:hypothetical protein FALBO_7712 [Fusarium albosuccineum]
MGNCDSKAVPELSISQDVAHIGIPQTLLMTYLDSLSKVAIQISIPGSPPSYTLCLPVGWTGCSTLHPGPSYKVPPMVYAAKKSRVFSIALPEVPSFNLPATHQSMQYATASDGLRYSFSMVVGQGLNQAAENFEWRRSSGPNVSSLKQVSEKLSSSGWVLLRVGSANHGITQQQMHYNHGSEQSTLGFSKDGKEIVAVWADPSLSLSTTGGFQFRGSGATPELGYHWVLVALMSSLCIWQHQTAKAIGHAEDIGDALSGI